VNKLDRAKQSQLIAALVEGNSIRAIERMTGVAKHTILKLIKDVGIAAADYQDRTLRNLKCRKIQVDEIWQFVYAKEKNVPADKIRSIRIRRRLDLGCHRCRHKVGSLFHDWKPRFKIRNDVYRRACQPPCNPRAAYLGRIEGLP
jgi:transposase